MLISETVVVVVVVVELTENDSYKEKLFSESESEVTSEFFVWYDVVEERATSPYVPFLEADRGRRNHKKIG